MTTLVDLLATRRCLLLDFDGPICTVFAGASNREAATMLASVLDSPLPEEIADTNDPFDVLQYAASLDPITAAAVERRFTEVELQAVKTAQPTPFTRRFLSYFAEVAEGIAVVTDNSTTAATAYFAAHDGYPRWFVNAVHGRTSADVSLGKSSPHLLYQAMEQCLATPDECCFVGDSVSDIETGQAAGFPVIAFADRPEKVQRFAEHAPAAIITSMEELSDAAALLL
ncbi:HAD family hydrolase [Nocardia otitidiscaviarum]|uniref:HAD family hydrolase n=1 Tax=Nocardia otitidiscaviarum TaxID=1823 RepID=A0A516NSK1_9NOCA|nr:HAD family hydrolase [Nocardia otitidiscaviarum]MCP9621138.1 HAD hydrolase-like protein [Nocardia otitidiscaviarum]QDP81890.1 HAD family hydrolase [Nocardia otitidiscaviarum]